MSRQILSRRQHAPNKRCALNSECAPDNPILWWWFFYSEKSLPNEHLGIKEKYVHTSGVNVQRWRRCVWECPENRCALIWGVKIEGFQCSYHRRWEHTSSPKLYTVSPRSAARARWNARSTCSATKQKKYTVQICTANQEVCIQLLFLENMFLPFAFLYDFWCIPLN